MLNEKQKNIHKEFRTYLKVEEGMRGNMLNTLINTAEFNLPVLIKEHFHITIDCIYDDLYTIEELLSFATMIKSNDEIKAAPYGYISSKVLDSYIRFYSRKNGIDLDNLLHASYKKCTDVKMKNDTEKLLIEGRLLETKLLRRQRNNDAREHSLKESGYKCHICGFDFGKVYGEIGKGFLEVHHIRPISTYDEEHKIIPSELVALCSNCHSMVHRRRPIPYSIEEIKEMINTNSV